MHALLYENISNLNTELQRKMKNLNGWRTAKVCVDVQMALMLLLSVIKKKLNSSWHQFQRYVDFLLTDDWNTSLCLCILIFFSDKLNVKLIDLKYLEYTCNALYYQNLSF